MLCVKLEEEQSLPCLSSCGPQLL